LISFGLSGTGYALSQVKIKTISEEYLNLAGQEVSNVAGVHDRGYASDSMFLCAVRKNQEFW
jgi:hypothetical protein